MEVETKPYWTIGKIAALVLVVTIVVASAIATVVYYSGRIAAQCKGTSTCLTDTVAYIVDGDTLDIGSTRIRLALVNTPEVGQLGYMEAKQFTAQQCPTGSQALVDEDDGQTGGSYGRMVGVVYCGGTNLNAELLRTGFAILLTDYCAVSEFAGETWTGCP